MNRPRRQGNYRRIALVALGALAAYTGILWMISEKSVGQQLDAYRDVAVFDNGWVYDRSHGRHRSADGYDYGQKWQCVEFIKRFYFQTRGHRMPDGSGHAKDFFDESVADEKMNPRRGMHQYRNGSTTPPEADDLLVFTDTKYGHVAIVTRVSGDSVEVIQQNIIGRPRQTFTLKERGGAYLIASPRAPAGWLRLP